MASLAISPLDKLSRGHAAPGGKRPPRGVEIVGLQRRLDVGVGVAEAAEPHQQVERGHVPDEAQQRVQAIERDVDHGGGEHRRRHGHERCNERVMRAAAVQLALDGARVPDERAARAPRASERRAIARGRAPRGWR